MPESRAGLCSLCACCLLPAQTGLGNYLGSAQECSNILGKPRWSPQGHYVPVGTQRRVALGKGKFWWGAHGWQLPTCLQQWQAEVAPSQQALTTCLQCLSCKCSAHTRSIFVIYLIFFYIIGIIFCSKHLPTIRPTVQNSEGGIKSCRGKQALLFTQKSLFYRFKKQNKTTATNHSPITSNPPKRWKNPSILYPCTTKTAASAIQQSKLADMWLLLALTASLWEALPRGHSSC